MGLPDKLLGPPPGFEDRIATCDQICMVVGAVAWVRAYIDVRLAGGGTFGIATWLEIEWEALPPVLAAWEDPKAYPSLQIDGWLGNGLRYWGREETFGAPARATVLDPDQLPTISSSSDPLLARILGEEWPADEVRSAYCIH